jgi:hypothetical protein
MEAGGAGHGDERENAEFDGPQATPDFPTPAPQHMGAGPSSAVARGSSAGLKAMRKNDRFDD